MQTNLPEIHSVVYRRAACAEFLGAWLGGRQRQVTELHPPPVVDHIRQRIPRLQRTERLCGVENLSIKPQNASVGTRHDRSRSKQQILTTCVASSVSGGPQKSPISVFILKGGRSLSGDTPHLGHPSLTNIHTTTHPNYPLLLLHMHLECTH